MNAFCQLVGWMGRHWPEHRGKRRLFFTLGFPALMRGRASFTTKEGIRLETDNVSDIMDRELFMYGSYQPEIVEIAEYFLRPGDLALDIGANNGYTAIILGRAVGSRGRVLAFEPNPERVAKLRVNAGLNGLSDVISVQNYGLGDTNAQRTFVVLENNSWNSRFANEDKATKASERAECLEINIRTLDDALLEPGQTAIPRLVKMDVEGFEAFVLRGAQRVLTVDRPVWYVEHNPELSEENGINALEVLRLFLDHGYEMYALRPRWFGKSKMSDLQKLSKPSEVIPMENVLFVHPSNTRLPSRSGAK